MAKSKWTGEQAYLAAPVKGNDLFRESEEESTSTINTPSRAAYVFFYLCNLPWYQLLIMAVSYFIFNIIFALLFYSIDGGMSYKEREEVLSLWTCFFFSIQTMDTIGYGLLSPLTWRCDVITMPCSILANFF